MQTQTLEAYGHGRTRPSSRNLWPAWGHFTEATPVRLHARTAMVVANHLIYLFRYANKDLPVTAARLKKKDGLRAELIRELGPEPMQGELDLGLDEFEEAHRGLAQIPPGTSLVIVAYACSMSEGIMRLEWGIADLRPDRYLQWHRHEPLSFALGTKVPRPGRIQHRLSALGNLARPRDEPTQSVLCPNCWRAARAIAGWPE